MAIVIPLQIMGNGEFNAAFKGMRDAVKEFKDEVADLKRILKAPHARSSQSPAAAAISQAGQAAKVARGPIQDLRNAHVNLQKAMQGGDPGQIWDAQHKVFTASNRLQKAHAAMNKLPSQPKGFGDLLRDAILTSRVGMGGSGGPQIMPLVSKLLPLLAEGGPVVLGLAAVVLGLKAFVDIAEAISTNQRDLSQARYAAGSTYGQVGTMAGIAGVTGQTTEQVAAAARAFANEIAMGGFAAGKFRGYGISDQPGPYGKINKFDNFERAIKILMQMPENEAIQTARSAPSLEPYLNMRDASPGKIEELMKMQKELITPESVRAAADFNIEMAELKLEFQQMIPLLTPFVKTMSNFLHFLRDSINAPSPFGGMPGFKPIPNKAADIKHEAAKAAQDRNTDAVNENTRELRHAREVIGGGDRSTKALSGSWRYNMVNQQLDSLANMVGPM